MSFIDWSEAYQIVVMNVWAPVEDYWRVIAYTKYRSFTKYNITGGKGMIMF